jgi:hypothetical protein
MPKTQRRLKVRKKSVVRPAKTRKPKKPVRRRMQARPATSATLKYSKYSGKPLDVQMRIALFGPEYESDPVATLIYETARAAFFSGITPFVFPPPKDVWFSVLREAIRTGDNGPLEHAARVAKRAHLSMSQPFDRLALQLLEVTLPHRGPPPTVDEFLTRYYPHLTAVNSDSKKRQIRMLCRMLGVKLRP